MCIANTFCANQQPSRKLRVSTDSESFYSSDSGEEYMEVCAYHTNLAHAVICPTEQFVDHYYNTFDTNRSQLAPLYVCLRPPFEDPSGGYELAC